MDALTSLIRADVFKDMRRLVIKKSSKAQRVDWKPFCVQAIPS